MRRLFPTELVYQVFSLLVSFIIVHAIYVAIVRPSAETFLTQERAKAKLDPSYEVPQSIYVILRDYEQESCFVLALWAIAGSLLAIALR